MNNFSVRDHPFNLILRVVAGCLLWNLAGAQNVHAQDTEPEIIEQILIVDDPSTSAMFGSSVEIDSLFAISGSPGDDSIGLNAGSAYFMINYLGTWMQRQKLSPADAAAGDRFGASVALDSVFYVVGSPGSDDGAGAAYVYQEFSAALQPGQRLAPDDLAEGDNFGQSVSVSGDVIVIGGSGHDAGGVNAGAAYVYRWNGSSWTQEAKLLAPDAAPRDSFGVDVAAYRDLVVIGASRDDSTGTDSGSIYVYRFNGATWLFEQKLVADHGNSYDLLGTSVDVAKDVVIAGAFGDNLPGLLNAGSATIWNYNGMEWSQEAVLYADDPGMDDHFGRTVAINDTLAVIGSHWHVRGTDFAVGAAYVYRNEIQGWLFIDKLVASNGQETDLFGESVAVYGYTVLVGAIRTDQPEADDAGSVYFYEIPRPVAPPPVVSVEDPESGLPEAFELIGVYPNPFQNQLSIDLRLDVPRAVSVRIYNISGQEVAVLADNVMENGFARYRWSPERHLASGIYLIRIISGPQVSTSKVALIR